MQNKTERIRGNTFITAVRHMCFFFFKYCYFYSLSLKQNYKEERGKRKKKSTEYIEKLSDKKREIDLDQSDPAPRRHENLTQQYF